MQRDVEERACVVVEIESSLASNNFLLSSVIRWSLTESDVRAENYNSKLKIEIIEINVQK